MSPLLTAEEVAVILHLGDKERVCDLVYEGKLAAVRIRERTIRFQREDVERYRTDKSPLVPLNPTPPWPKAIRELFGSVYFVRSAEYVKIGFTTKSMTERMKYLQTGNPVQMELLHVVRNAHCGFERALQRDFAGAQHREEWFRTDGEMLHPDGNKILTIAKFIKALARDEAAALAEMRLPWVRREP